VTPLLPHALLLLLAGAAEGQVLDRVAATVNGEVITLSDLVERSGADYRRAEELAAGEARDQSRAKALQAAFDQAVAEKLFDAEAKNLSLEATDAQVDAAIEDIKKRNRFSDALLDQALQEQGLTKETFRRQLRRDLETFQILNTKVRSRVKVTDEDVQNYYQSHAKEFSGEEQVRVRHVFLALPKGASPAEEGAVRTKGEAVLRRLREGADFAAVAREVSQGPSGAEGGDLGWLRRGAIQPELEKAAFALGTGQVSDLVRTRTGFHVLKVEERRTGGARQLEEVKESIRDRLVEEQLATYRSQYVAELRKDAVIEVKMPELRP
jgi:peptidyl-prolyl cis-trans isomerase SurA